MSNTNRFTKFYDDTHRSEIESLKTVAAGAVAARSGEFKVPRVIECSETGLTTEYVPGLVSLRTVLTSESRRGRENLAKRAGRVLAQLHTWLNIPGEALVLEPPFHGPDVVPIHGDFGLTNIQIRTEDDTLYILDWSTPAWFGSSSTHGAAAWDLGMFVSDVAYQRPRDPAFLPDPLGIVRAFLDGYAGIRGLPRSYRTSVRMVMRRYYGSATPGVRRALRLPYLCSVSARLP